MAREQIAKRFVDFFLVEQQLKLKVYLSAVGIALLWTLIRLVAFHKSEEQVSIESGIVLCLVIVLAVAVYMLGGATCSAPEKRMFLDFYLLGHLKLTIVGAAVAVVLLAFMVKADVPSLQAAVVNFRLELLATGTAEAAGLSDTQLRNRYLKIASIVDKAATNQIPVDQALLRKAQRAVASSLKARTISDQTKQLGLATAIDLQSLAYTRDVQSGSVNPRQISNTGGYMIASPVVLDGRNKNTFYFVGEHSWFALAPDGYFAIQGGSFVFDKLDFRGFFGPNGAIALIDPQSDVLVHDAILENVRQNLDRITWVEVRFEKSRIAYTEGAPLRLRHVSFNDCDLSGLHTPPGWGPLSSELEKRITEAGGQPITFIYEPNSLATGVPGKQ